MSTIQKAFIFKAAKLSAKANRACFNSCDNNLEESLPGFRLPMREVAPSPVRTHWHVRHNPPLHMNLGDL